MAFLKENKYWKIVNMKVDRQLKKSTITIVGFLDKEDADKPKLAQFIPGYQKKIVILEKNNYPFTTEVANPTAVAYANVKLVDKFFSDSEDV